MRESERGCVIQAGQSHVFAFLRKRQNINMAKMKKKEEEKKEQDLHTHWVKMSQIFPILPLCVSSLNDLQHIIKYRPRSKKGPRTLKFFPGNVKFSEKFQKK